MESAMKTSSSVSAQGSSTAAYMASAGVPGALLPVVIATEVLGALAVILGWKTRIAATLLAGFSLLAAFAFSQQLRRPDPDDHVPQERVDHRRVSPAHR
jgi:uncharacterized membrane protein YphA (DoxX/SURF4 family)